MPGSFQVLPFLQERMPNGVLLINVCGDHIFASNAQFEALLSGSLDPNGPFYLDLKSKHFISDRNLSDIVNMLSIKFRSKKAFLLDFTSLHMVVVTLRCNHKCEYCQVSSEAEDAWKWDMKPETMRVVIDYVFQSPSPRIKIEFQGGEPLLNWETVRFGIEYAEEKNKTEKRELEFVICTNLYALDENILAFIKDRNVYLSTSLDGPQPIHDAQRILRSGGSSYERYRRNLDLVLNAIGPDRISALMTTTRRNIDKLPDVIDEYVRLGFQGIFLRSINPYGFAADRHAEIGYDLTSFTEAYKIALDYILKINMQGHFFPEYYTTLLLQRILTPFSTGFVDLQSPSGAGISGAIYDWNGDVFPADEARMLARMGDRKFFMGNAFKNTYEEIFSGNTIRDIVRMSCVEILPLCATCPFSIYCGADPIRNYLERKDLIGHRPTSDFCRRNLSAFRHIFTMLEKGEEQVTDVFWSWVIRRPCPQSDRETMMKTHAIGSA